MIKIEITIQDEYIEQFGAVIVGGFIQNKETGRITGVSEVMTAGFVANGEPEEGDIVWAEVVQDSKFQKRVRRSR